MEKCRCHFTVIDYSKTRYEVSKKEVICTRMRSNYCHGVSWRSLLAYLEQVGNNPPLQLNMLVNFAISCKHIINNIIHKGLLYPMLLAYLIKNLCISHRNKNTSKNTLFLLVEIIFTVQAKRNILKPYNVNQLLRYPPDRMVRENLEK